MAKKLKPKLIDRVAHVLTKAFPGAEVKVEIVRSSGRVAGEVFWKGFKDVEMIDRQAMLREALEAGLMRKELLELSLFMTFTPREVRYMKAG